MINTTKALMVQYDFKTAIPLTQAVHDYYHPTMDEAQIRRLANDGKFPFACYKAEPDNKKSGWYVNLESLAKWLDNRKTEAEKDHLAMAG